MTPRRPAGPFPAGRGRDAARGATLVEFTLMAPVITLVGLMTLQWALSFHGRNQVAHAGFMAARAGATSQAQPAAIEEAYARSLAPLYGGGRNAAEVEQAVARARADLSGFVRIDVMNPSLESFADWADPALQRRLSAPRRVIANDGLALLSPQRAQQLGAQSGQTLADANQLHLRITTGLPLQVPFAAPLVRQVLRWTDDQSDPFASQLIASGRLPSTVDVVVRMQSPAMESDAVRSMADRTGPRSARTPDRSGQSLAPPTACSTAACANGPASPPSPAPASDLAPGPAGPTPPAGTVVGDALFCTRPG